MNAEKIIFHSIRGAREAIEAIGADNSQKMAGRAVHINIRVKNVPGKEARRLKSVYNDIGAEAAISRSAYEGAENIVTEMIIMGTLYQHREVKRVFQEDEAMAPWIQVIARIVENCAEAAE
jgi:hypothetical protein